MGDEIGIKRRESPGRLFNITVFGDNAEEIEMAALDEARKFFGPDPRLSVVRNYSVMRCAPADAERAGGKKYFAGMRIRVIEHDA